MDENKITCISEEEARFLSMVNDQASQPNLEARLAQLGLLAAFLEVKNGTT